MSKLPTKFIYRKNSFYHIYNRGNEKKEIFRGKKDYKVFKNQFFKYCKKYRLLSISFCLMPNHYHLIIKCWKNKDDISKFMHAFMTSYVMYFNREHKRVGRLFQSPFQIRRITDLKDLHTVINYLRKNPLEAELLSGLPLEKYEWFYLRDRMKKVQKKNILSEDEQILNSGQA